MIDLRERQFTLSLYSRMLGFFDKQFQAIRLLLSKPNPIKLEGYKEFQSAFIIANNELGAIKEALGGILGRESIKVDATANIDMSELLDRLQSLTDTVKEIKIPQTSLDGVVKGLEAVKKQIASIPEPKEVIIPPFPKQDKFPKEISMIEGKDIVDRLEKLRVAISQLKTPKVEIPGFDLNPLAKRIEEAIEKIPKSELPESIAISNFPPTKTPQPVTNININPLRGLVHTTVTTITSVLSAIPGYGVLENRRSIIFYNNSSTVTIYVGGSTVTSSNGIPIDPKSYSPSFDSGPTQVWYGVTSSGLAEVRCVELQNSSGA